MTYPSDLFATDNLSTVFNNYLANHSFSNRIATHSIILVKQSFDPFCVKGLRTYNNGFLEMIFMKIPHSSEGNGNFSRVCSNSILVFFVLKEISQYYIFMHRNDFQLLYASTASSYNNYSTIWIGLFLLRHDIHLHFKQIALNYSTANKVLPMTNSPFLYCRCSTRRQNKAEKV